MRHGVFSVSSSLIEVLGGLCRDVLVETHVQDRGIGLTLRWPPRE
jgi:hypothetical protein